MGVRDGGRKDGHPAIWVPGKNYKPNLMNSFQSQIVTASPPLPPTDFSPPFEVLLGPDQSRIVQLFLPRGMALITHERIHRSPSKRLTPPFSAEAEPSPGEKRHAYLIALNRISNPSEANVPWFELLNKVKKHPKAGFFATPVDPEAMDLPTYRDVVKEPMDFSTVQRKLEENAYATYEEFDSDMQKIFNNAVLFNRPQHQVARAAEEVRGFYMRQAQEKFGLGVGMPKKSSKAFKQADSERKTPRARLSVVNATPLSHEEKQKLIDMIRNKLSPEDLEELWGIVASDQKSEQEDLNLDIEALSPRTSRKLEAFVTQKVQKAPKKRRSKAEEPPKPPLSQNAPVNAAPKAEARPLRPKDSDSSYISRDDSDD